MTPLYYFAYGSNMSSARLLARTPRARSLGIHELAGHQLLFHKHGKDDSGKCNAFASGDPRHKVLGVAYEMHPQEKPTLDQIEGVGWGYELKTVTVTGPDGRSLECFTYSAIRIADNLLPYEWYLHHVVTGAQEAGLPQPYVAALTDIPCKPDPDRARHQQEMSIHGQY